MTYNLFLDDLRKPKQAYDYTKNKIYLNLNWVIARTYKEFRDILINRGLPQVVSFDFDLSYHRDNLFSGAILPNKEVETYLAYSTAMLDSMAANSTLFVVDRSYEMYADLPEEDKRWLEKNSASGADCAQLFKNLQDAKREYRAMNLIHSANVVGAQKIRRVFDNG